METKEIITQSQAQAPAVQSEPMDTSFHDMGFTSRDAIISRIQLMQSTSPLVGEGQFKLGDIIDASENKLLADTTKGVELVPVWGRKVWHTYDVSAGKGIDTKVWLRTEPCTAANANLKWDDMEDGKPIMREVCVDFYVMLKDQLEAGQGGLPFIVSFRRTSMPAGKQIATHILKMAAMKLPMWARSFTLKSAKQKDPKSGAYYATFMVTSGSQVSPAAGALAAEAQNTIKTSAIRELPPDEASEKPAEIVVESKPFVKPSAGDDQLY